MKRLLTVIDSFRYECIGYLYGDHSFPKVCYGPTFTAGNAAVERRYGHESGARSDTGTHVWVIANSEECSDSEAGRAAEGGRREHGCEHQHR